MTKNACWIKSSVANLLVEMGNECAPKETGGLLFGYIGDNGDPVITEASIAGPNAVGEPRGFTPDYEHDAEKVNEIYRMSDGMISYLGDWHSHPAGGVRTSRRDYKTLLNMERAHRPFGHSPIMLILGHTVRGKWECAVHQLEERSLLAKLCFQVKARVFNVEFFD